MFDSGSRYVDAGAWDPQATDRLHRVVIRAGQLLREDPARYVPLMATACAEYETACAALASTLGLDVEVADALVARMRAFLTYLVTSARLPPSVLAEMAARTGHVVIASATHEIPDFASGDVVRFDIARGELLQSQAVASEVDRLLRDAGSR
jgi:hypothetical protein